MTPQHKSHDVERNEIEYLNRALEKTARLNAYTAAQVLTLYWEDEKEGFQNESRQIGNVFNNMFGYPVKPFAIPLSNSYLELHRYVTGEALGLSKRTEATRGLGLMIIYYGGHGDRNDRKHEGENRQAVWSS
jgi:hypothetical protein